MVAPMAQFFFVARNKMDAEINGDADQNRRKRYGEEVQMTDHCRREGHGVSKSYQQTKRRFDWPPRLVIAIHENQRHDDERNNRRLFSIALRLRHLIDFE